MKFDKIHTNTKFAVLIVLVVGVLPFMFYLVGTIKNFGVRPIELSWIFLYLSAGCLSVGLILVLRFFRRVSRQINSLIKAAQTVSQGNFEIEVNIDPKEELGILAQAVISMADNLKQTTVSKELVENIFTSMVESVIVVRIDKTISLVNQATEKLLKYSSEELLGQPIGKILLEEIFEKTASDSLVKQGFFRDIENTYRTKEGSLIPVSLSGAVMFDQKIGVQGIVCVAQDITKRKQIEAELQRAKEEAEAMALAKSQFCSNISHELRTPLNAILGISELLSDSMLRPNEAEYIGLIHRAARSLLTLISNVLEFSNNEMISPQIIKTDFNLQDCLEDLVQRFKHKAEHFDIDIKLIFSNQLEKQIKGDKRRIVQVLTQLIDNAIKFAEKRGQVEVKVSVLTKSSIDQTVKFEIIDSGIGISEEKKKEIFTPFWQIDGSLTRKYGGTGLGLAICRKLAQAMGGEIEVESMEGKGSNFSFTCSFEVVLGSKDREDNQEKRESDRELLINNTNEITLPVNILGDYNFSKPYILVVDDNSVNQRVTVKLLEKLGYAAETADNGKEAIDKIRANNYAAVLMDCQMPVMDGYEATAQVRAMEGSKKDTLIIALTAHAMQGDREKCINAGMHDYLSKPISKEVLGKVLAKYIS